MRIIIGVATVPARYPFFSKKVLPNLKAMSDEVWVYTDGNSPVLIRHTSFGTSLVDCPHQSVGDAGKFFGAELYGQTLKTIPEYYYFSCDDDLIYPTDYATRMIEWIDFLDKKVVVSLHGSTFIEMPVTSYYRDKRTIPCLGDFHFAQRIIFPGSGAAAFHSSLVDINIARDFPIRNMADIWFGKLLQEQKVPAIVLPHGKGYLTYDNSVAIEDTIWGQEHDSDFVQTALVNQLSLSPGLLLHPLDWPEGPLPQELGSLPEALPQPQPDQQELSPSQAPQSEELDISKGAS